MKLHALALAGVASMLAACATPMPLLPSLTTFERTDCAAVPDTGAAIDLTPQKDKTAWTIEHPMRAGAPCLMQDGEPVPYAVFALPPAGSSRAVELGSVLEPGRLFSPRVTLLDAGGKPVRHFANDKLMFRSSIYSVRFVPGEEERFALVTAEPTLIGKAYDAIRSNIVTTTVYTGFGVSNWRSGAEAETSHAFSYDGLVRGIVYRPED